MATVFDLILAAAVLVFALRALFAPYGREAIFSLLFTGFLMAIVWMRLNAVDIALVEAAVGGGLSAAILMEISTGDREPDASKSRFFAAGAVLGAGAILYPLSPFLSDLATPPLFGAARYAALQNETGAIANPVTAVLLNYRGYDTLLEVAVLLLATIAALTFARDAPAHQPRSGALFTRLMAAPLVLFAAYLLFEGSGGHGGAFQAAAVLASALVLSALTSSQPALTPRKDALLLAGGFFFFVLAGALMQLFNGVFLAYDPASEAASVFAVEAVLTFSIGWGLYRLYHTIAGADA